MSEKLSAVVVAAGKSSRMGFDKLMTPLAGAPLLQHTLRGILSSPEVAEVVLVVRPETEEKAKQITDNLESDTPIIFTHGGAERQDSVRNGLAATPAEREYVLIQDAARPFISAPMIESTFAAAREHGAAVTGHPSTDTLKQAQCDGLVEQTLDRSVVWAVQTPQIFQKTLLREAYDAVKAAGHIMTDDTAAVEFYGRPVQIVAHEGVNLKVTRPSDWALAEAYLTCGIPDSMTGQQLRRLLHDMNNHLTPLLGYSFLLGNEFEPGSKGKKFCDNINTAGERANACVQEIQKIARKLFPRSSDPGATPNKED